MTSRMKRIILCFLLIFLSLTGFSQVAVPMLLQPGLTYTENFADITNWSSGFASGIGANRFAPVPVLNSGSIPSAGKTTLSSATFSSGIAGGIQKGSGNIMLLSVGSTDNTSSVAFDLLLDFTGTNAGSLSFDWASVNNSSGDRKGSLRIYASPDGINFTELAGAAVLNFTNNIQTSGTVTNVPLPAAFGSSANAVLRFYYHNGTGGSAGSRPKISIDNLVVTASSMSPCVTPTAQPTSLSFSNVTSNSMQGNFTAASPAPDQYLTVVSTNNSLTSFPIDGQTYSPGDGLGDGVVSAYNAGTTFTASGLASATTYYYFIFSVNNNCGAGPRYLVSNPLTGSMATTSGLPPCSTPATQPTNLVFNTAGINSISGIFNPTAATDYLVIYTSAASLSFTPVNGQVYNTGDVAGNAVVVQSGPANSFNATGLSANTLYHFYVFALNTQGCSNGPVYNGISPLTNTQTTLPLPACSIPGTQPTAIQLTASNNAVTGSFSSSFTADSYLIIRSTSPTLSGSPVNNTDYTPGNNIGGGIVVANSPSLNFLSNNLAPATTYYFFVFAANKNCTGGTKYLTTNPLKGNVTTSNAIPNQYYFGTFHSHSDYSDGNKDNPGYTPADDYNYAMTSQCMDYLGISEHNHYSSAGNPGNHVATYHAGTAQADAFNSAHANFVAMYGMEWGIISGGGHVLVYGDGMDDLFGWETGSGAWGSSNNYDVYVPKNTYTGSNGLFKTINDNNASFTFGSLAHPAMGDFNNLDNIAYDVTADNAIVGTAVESGPAASTNNTYSNPASSLGYLWYYQLMLSKGYHLGPTIDHDNHNTTFGRTTYSRTAVIAPSLNKTELIKAMRNMHFYATQDCDAKVDFTINSKIMGSAITDRYAPVISVNLTDATSITSSAVIRIMYGIPGSLSLPAVIASGTGSTFNYIDNNIPNMSTGYYYVDITNNGKRIITSPIWYSRNDFIVLPVKLGSFVVHKVNRSAELNWNTQQEINSKYFSIERSADAVHWKNIGTVNAAGNSNAQTDYLFYDENPLDGINYYRLKQVDKDGSETFSEVRTLFFDLPNRFTISPNPASDFIKITLAIANQFNIVVSDINGRIILEQKNYSTSVQINISSFAKGIYFVKLTSRTGTAVEKILVN